MESPLVGKLTKMDLSTHSGLLTTVYSNLSTETKHLSFKELDTVIWEQVQFVQQTGNWLAGWIRKSLVAREIQLQLRNLN